MNRSQAVGAGAYKHFEQKLALAGRMLSGNAIVARVSRSTEAHYRVGAIAEAPLRRFIVADGNGRASAGSGLGEVGSAAPSRPTR